MKAKIEQEALKAYSAMRETAKAHKLDPEDGKEVTDCIELAKSARLLAMDFEKFNTIFEEIHLRDDGYMQEKDPELMAVLLEMKSGKVAPETEAKLSNAMYEKAMASVERFVWEPLVLPFDCVFLAFHNCMPQAQRSQERANISKAVGMKSFLRVIMGYLLTKDSIYEYAYEITETSYVRELSPLFHEGVATLRVNSTGHISFVKALQAVFKSVQKTGITRISKAGLEGKKLTKLGKQYCHIPRDYHLITIQDGIRYEEPEPEYEEIESSAQGYCYDVIGHTATRILRGALPMEERLERYLSRDPRRVIVRSREDLTDDLRHMFLKRGIYYRDSEWISVLTFPVKPHQRNKDKPYVPATYSLDAVQISA